MGRPTNRPPDGVVDVHLEERPTERLEIELRILPPPPPGPRLRERVRDVAVVARRCLKAADGLSHPETGPRPESSPEPEARDVDVPVRRAFCRFFELLFRQVMADVLAEGRNLLRAEERLHINLKWRKPGGFH